MSISFRSAVASSSRGFPAFTSLPSSSLARPFSISPSAFGPKSPKDAPAKPRTDTNRPEALSLEEAHRLHRAWQIGRPHSGIYVDFVVELDKKVQSMRGRTIFPRSTAIKEDVVLVFCAPEQEEEALDAGASIVGGAELIPDVLSGKLQPDSVLSTTAMIDEISTKLSRFLGPKNLMPNIKRGTVFSDVTKGIKANRGGVDWKVNKVGGMDLTLGRADWPLQDIEDNLLTVLEDLRNCTQGSAALDIHAAKPVNVLQIYLHSKQAPGTMINDILTRPRPRGY